MNEITLNGCSYSVDDRIASFLIQQKPSSNVDFFGTSQTQLFVQFKNGTSYIYSDVDQETLRGSHESESIGQFMHRAVKGKFESLKFDGRLVVSTSDRDSQERPATTIYLEEPGF